MGKITDYKRRYGLGLQVKRLDGFVNLQQRREGDAGFDLYATENIVIPAGEQRLIKTGIATSFSPDYYLRIAPRSGLAFKHSIDVMAGVIDSSYRGEIGVILRNCASHGDHFTVSPGDRIAQMIPERISTEPFMFVQELDDSTRGEGGFGSTGK